MSNSQILKYISVGLTLALAYYFLDFNELWSSLKSVNINAIFISTGLIILCFITAGLRWGLLCKGVGLSNISIKKKIKLNYAASFVDMVLPIYGGSDVFCLIVLSSNRKKEGWNAAASVLATRINGYVVAVIIACASGLFLDIPSQWRMAIIVTSIISMLAILFLPLLIKKLSKKFKSLKQIPLKSIGFRKAWAMAFGLSIISQILLISSRAWVGWGLGIDLSWMEYAFISSALILLTPFVPSFGFIGLGTATFVTLAAIFGATPEAATALSIAWYGCWLIATMPGLIFFNSINGKDVVKKISNGAISIMTTIRKKNLN